MTEHVDNASIDDCPGCAAGRIWGIESGHPSQRDEWPHRLIAYYEQQADKLDQKGDELARQCDIIARDVAVLNTKRDRFRHAAKLIKQAKEILDRE